MVPLSSPHCLPQYSSISKETLIPGIYYAEERKNKLSEVAEKSPFNFTSAAQLHNGHIFVLTEIKIGVIPC